jgi:hypothetical protein
MPTPQEVRRMRLKSDYAEMCNIRGHIISWRAGGGAPPYVEEYELTVNVRSIVGRGPRFRSRHSIRVELPCDYPWAPPRALMTDRPVVFHPNWWRDHQWCYGCWDISEGLGHFVVRMVRTLQFDPVITNEDYPANAAARVWYLANRGRGLFPCDAQVLPDPSRSRREARHTAATPGAQQA